MGRAVKTSCCQILGLFCPGFRVPRLSPAEKGPSRSPKFRVPRLSPAAKAPSRRRGGLHRSCHTDFLPDLTPAPCLCVVMLAFPLPEMVFSHSCLCSQSPCSLLRHPGNTSKHSRAGASGKSSFELGCSTYCLVL